MDGDGSVQKGLAIDAERKSVPRPPLAQRGTTNQAELTEMMQLVAGADGGELLERHRAAARMAERLAPAIGWHGSPETQVHPAHRTKRGERLRAGARFLGVDPRVRRERLHHVVGL